MAIVVVALLAYLILGSGLTVTMEMEIAPASTYAEEYVRMIGSEEGIESYSIVHIVAQAKNKGMLPAEWVELNFSTLEGDRLAYDAQIGPSDIPAFGSATFSVSILTQNSDARSAWLSYYLMGAKAWPSSYARIPGAPRAYNGHKGGGFVREDAPQTGHALTLEGRARAVVTGVSDVELFNEQLVALSTVAGTRCTIMGNELHISQLQPGERFPARGRTDRRARVRRPAEAAWLEQAIQ